MFRLLSRLALAVLMAANASGQWISYSGGVGGGSVSVPGAEGDAIVSDGSNGLTTAPVNVTDAAFTYTPSDVDNFDVSFGGNLFSVHVTGGAAEFTFEGDSSFDGRTQGQYFRATESTADTNPVKYGWVSPDATLYGVEMRGASGTRPYSIGLQTEGTMRAWFNYQGSNYLTGPHRFTGNFATTNRVGITNDTLAGVDSVVAVVDSDYTLPAINEEGIYQGDGDGESLARVYTIIRGNTTNPVALIATGDDVIEVQGSSEAAGVVTYTWISAASIDFTKKGAGARCQEAYYRVSTGPDVFKAAWFCAPIGFGIEVSP